MKSLIYSLKRLIQSNHFLYRLLFNLATFNVDYCKQLLSTRGYPSRFGGMWTDRSDFAEELQRKQKALNLSRQDCGDIQQWHKDGYVIFENLISHDLIDQLVRELDELPQQHPPALLMTGAKFDGARQYSPELITPDNSIRIVDFYFFSELARGILLDPKIVNFLDLVFEADPILTQSLSFQYGSGQPIHQDTAYVITNSPQKLAAVWIALEDVQPGAGELAYYPGSHHWDDFLFSKYFKHFDLERDGKEQERAWLNWLNEEADRRGVEKTTFLPRKGDVLLWHASLAHGGSTITTPDSTRKSLVGHYCPQGVRPLYHYYKPNQRKFYQHGSLQYSSAYYTR